jgi:hypothetical protein
MDAPVNHQGSLQEKDTVEHAKPWEVIGGVHRPMLFDIIRRFCCEVNRRK